MTADATVGTAESAFHTSIASFTQAGTTVLANTQAAQVPAALGGVVSAVLGLSSLGAAAAPSVSLPKLTGYYPAEFSTVYDGSKTGPGSGTTLAVIAEVNLTQTVTDLRTAEKAQKLPQAPVSVVPSASPARTSAEWTSGIWTPRPPAASRRTPSASASTTRRH